MNKKLNPRGGIKGVMLSSPSKVINSASADEHMGLEAELRKHAKIQNKHANRVRKRKGLNDLDDVLIPKPDNRDDFESRVYDEDDDLGVSLGDLILCRRSYIETQDGPEGSTIDENEFIALHSWIRRERSKYIDADGRIVTVGTVVSQRKGKDFLKGNRKDPNKPKRTVTDRKASGVLRTVMVRLMPHEGRVAGELLKGKELARAVDETVRFFAKATGAQIISAVVHRMACHDLHVHIQYTMVLPECESPTKFGRRKRPWEDNASKKAKESLAEDFIRDFEGPPEKLEIPAIWAPAKVGKRIKDLIASGELTPPPKPEVVFRKHTARRMIADEAILGYAFKSKLNLVREAEAADRPDLAEKITAAKDSKGRFRPFTIAPQDTLEKMFLDVWLEGVWRRSVKRQLSDDAQNRIRAAAILECEKYAEFGTVFVEETHFKGKMEEIKKASDEAVARIADAKASVRRIKEQAVRSAWEKVWGAFTGNKPVPGKSAKDFEAAIKPAVEDLREKTIAGALGDVFSLLLPGRKLVSESEVGIRKELFVGVKQVLADGYTGVLGALFPGRKSQEKSIRGLKSELETAVVEFKAAAMVEAVENVLGDRLENIRGMGRDPVAELSAELRRLQESELLLRGFLKVEVPAQGQGAKFKAAVVKLLTKHDKARGKGTEVKLEKSPKKQEDSPDGLT